MAVADIAQDQLVEQAESLQEELAVVVLVQIIIVQQLE